MSSNRIVINGAKSYEICDRACDVVAGICDPDMPVSLSKCPPGLFLFNGVLGIKTERCDDDGKALVFAADGTDFLGIATTTKGRDLLKVRPIPPGDDIWPTSPEEDDVAKIRIRNRDKVAIEDIAAAESRTFAGQCRLALREWVVSHKKRSSRKASPKDILDLETPD